MEDSISKDPEVLLRVLKPLDFDLLALIENKGPIWYDPDVKSFGEEGKSALIRLKARGLVVPMRLKSDKSRHSHYRYDMTRLGLDMLAEYRHREEERAKEEVLQKDYVR